MDGTELSAPAGSAPIAMAAPLPENEPPSLLRITIRRALVSGRMYLAIGIAVSTLFGVSLGLAGGSTGQGIVALLLPIYAIVGGMGGLMVFTNDRIKGVLEYLLAYGLSPRRLFLNVLTATVVLVAVVLAVSIGVTVAATAAGGGGVTEVLVLGIALYTVPMSIGAAALAVTIGMYWTSLSSPREGMSSPIGLVPIVGIAPPIIALIAAEAAHGISPFLVPAACVVGVLLLLAILLSGLDRWLARERLLSPG